MGLEKQSWSIIILCYNEADSILSVMQNSIDWIQNKALITSELIIVNDGSSDDSDKIISEFIEKVSSFSIQYFHQKQNLGIGISLKNAYQAAKKENVVMIPGDGQFDLNELSPYYSFNNQELIAFYRAQNLEYSYLRKILTAFNRSINKHFFNLELRDVNWVKAYKTKALQQLTLTSSSSLIETEICAKLIAKGTHPIEVASTYKKRESGESKGASWPILKQALFDLPLLIKSIRTFQRQEQA